MDVWAHSKPLGVTLRLSSFDGRYAPAATVHGRPSWRNGAGRVLYWSTTGAWHFGDAVREDDTRWASLFGAAEVPTGASVQGKQCVGESFVGLAVVVSEEARRFTAGEPSELTLDGVSSRRVCSTRHSIKRRMKR